MHGITETILETFAQHWLSIGLSLIVAWLVKNRYNNGLNKYPGPFLASLTDWWRFFDVKGCRPEVTHQKLHAKYGDVVRLGPNTLSFADPAALKSIYGLNKGFVKVEPRWSTPQYLQQLTISVRLLHRPAVYCQGLQTRVPVQHDEQ